MQDEARGTQTADVDGVACQVDALMNADKDGADGVDAGMEAVHAEVHTSCCYSSQLQSCLRTVRCSKRSLLRCNRSIIRARMRLHR